MSTTPSPSPSPSVEILRYAGVPAGQITAPIGRLIVLLAQRYGLDPALKHLEVIPAKSGLAVYVSADGWRFIADRSGELDGITFVDVSQGEHGWRATVHVWRKGCSHPFEGRAGCGFDEKQVDPEAVAVTRATRRALRNGFASSIRVEAEYQPLFADQEPVADEDVNAPLPTRLPPSPRRPVVGPPRRDTPSSSRADQAAAHRVIGELALPEQKAWLERHAITDFGSVWPDKAVRDALEAPFGTGWFDAEEPAAASRPAQAAETSTDAEGVPPAPMPTASPGDPELDLS
jgi:hypothetical protein